MDLGELQSRTSRATTLLKAMSNPVRLMVLCQLAEGERTVGELERAVRISQSALSQHLALLRQRGLVRCRRAGQTVRYSLAGWEVPALLAALYEVFCSELRSTRPRRSR